ncbi:ABC transporter substrate-binding protein [Alicyclobacillus shizuokensis]|uniref:ABC transporter substrate-binding protein n=1 Tax=Alicyclobacillus shizuokensis TaxID=392014 RepID=UPI00082BF77D|nr:extracellular solute-binding protein [Alicyclobacillus shizuokensis]
MKAFAKCGAMIAGASVLLAGLVTGCGNSDSSKNSGDSNGKVKISFLTLWPAPQVAMFKKDINTYEKSHPNVSIEVRTVPFGNLLSTITTDSLSSDGPTIFDIYDLWIPQLAKDGILAPAPREYSSDIESNYASNIVASTKYGSAIYGYPNEVDDYALNYNKALFKAAGIQTPPKTWSELIADAKKLTKTNSSGQIIQQGFGTITSWNSGVVHPWLAMVLSDGGRLVNSRHQPQLTSKAAEAVTQLYQDMVKKYKVTNPSMSTANASTTGPYLDNFANGKTGMIIMANWWESALKSSMGANFKNVGVAPIPVGPDGDGSHTVYYSWLTAVNNHATPAQQQAAWAFLKWVNSPESGKNGSSAIGDILSSEGIMPSRTSDIAAHKSQLDEPFMKAYVDALKTAEPFPVVFAGDELTTIIQKSIESVEFGSLSPSTAMSQAQSNATQLLSQYYKAN